MRAGAAAETPTGDSGLGKASVFNGAPLRPRSAPGNLVGLFFVRGDEWDEVELLLIRGLEQHGFKDAFRTVHGYRCREISWGWARWPGGDRLDHLLVAKLLADDCPYEHLWREERLSDHSPLISRLRRPDALERAAQSSHNPQLKRS